jgi:hypothetical protein
MTPARNSPASGPPRGRSSPGPAAGRCLLAFFAKLPSSVQRYHVDNITAAKSAGTRQRSVEKAIALFRAGKQR